MALARIISRSHQCSRELALDLLARGYAVEIVSPDAVPDNIADLELRVDSGPGDLLTANVETHNGAHSASLEFVHHLKSPMVDFRRRPPQASQPIPSPAPPFVMAEPVAVSKVAEKVVDLPRRSAVDARRASEPIPLPPPTLPAAVVIAPPIVAPQPARIGLTEPEKTLNPAVTAAVPKSKPERKIKSKPTPNNRDRNDAWFWRAAVSSGCVLTMAFVLSFGVQSRSILSVSDSAFSSFKVLATDRQTETGGEKSAPANPVQTAQPSALDSSAAKPLATPATAPVIRKAEEKPARASRKSARPKVEVAASRRHHQTSRRHADDLVAPNTIVYYDRPGTQPTQAKTKQAKTALHPGAVSPKKGDGVIAASAIPSAKPASKPVPPK